MLWSNDYFMCGLGLNWFFIFILISIEWFISEIPITVSCRFLFCKFFFNNLLICINYFIIRSEKLINIFLLQNFNISKTQNIFTPPSEIALFFKTIGLSKKALSNFLYEIVLECYEPS